MPNPLAGVDILVTRPRHQAQALCELIEKKGGSAVLLPTIVIKPPHNKEKFELLFNQLNTVDIAIFVSQHAVHAANLHWPEETPSTMKIVAIGPGTKQALKKNNLPVHNIPAQYNSEGLLALPVLNSVQQKSIVIFSGENPRTLLSTELRQRGALVTEAMGYRRACPSISDAKLHTISSRPLDCIVSTSQESLQNLVAIFHQSREWLFQQRLLVISPTMAKLAQSTGFTQKPLIANNATDLAIVDTLISHPPVTSRGDFV